MTVQLGFCVSDTAQYMYMQLRATTSSLGNKLQLINSLMMFIQYTRIHVHITIILSDVYEMFGLK